MAYMKTASSDDLSTFASRLRNAREQQGLSRHALAAKTSNQVTDRVINHLEGGTTDATVERARLLADALGVGLDWLISGAGEEPESDAGVDADQGKAPQLSQAETDLDANGYVDNLRNVLAEIDSYRYEGLQDYRRRITALIEDASRAASYLEADELLEVALERGVDVPHDPFQADQDGPDRVEPLLEALTERMIDTAILGLDLHELDMEVLTKFAKAHKVSKPRVGFFFDDWGGHDELVSALRPSYRQAALEGALSLKRSLAHQE